MNTTRTYFIRTRNRNRILATIVCRIVQGGLAFGISRASADEPSPSRKVGRHIATQRLEAFLASGGTPQYRPVYRGPAVEDDSLLVAGLLPVNEIVPKLNRIVLESQHTNLSIPSWAWDQDIDCFNTELRDQYLDMFCKLRNCAEKGSF